MPCCSWSARKPAGFRWPWAADWSRCHGRTSRAAWPRCLAGSCPPRHERQRRRSARRNLRRDNVLSLRLAASPRRALSALAGRSRLNEKPPTPNKHMMDRMISIFVAVSLALLVWLYARSRDQEILDNVLLPVQVALPP